jgi:EAL domain-containing protein (putative c-di-GMP-specific phosphodiesterase class I)
MLDQTGTVQVYLIRIEQEQLLEAVVGWELYDRLVMDTASFLGEILGDGGVLCQEHVRSDVFFVFTADPEVAARLQTVVAEGIPVSGEDTGGLSRLVVRLGRGRIWRRPAMRMERCVYGGIIDARRDFHRRGEALDESRREELRQMLRDRSVRTLFQPILRLAGRSVVGYEALSRGPAGSYLEPAENLFGFTERAGLLGEVEQLCVERALHNAKEGLLGGCSLFINLSMHGLEYLETEGGGLARVVDRVGWPATDFVLEITERTYAESPERLQSRADALRGHGFRIAIDDMGTGFSSLNVLAELEPEYIKLDHSLVRDLATKPIKRNLVKAITGFAQTSRSIVIAEGVERQDELDALEDLGIDLVQGFYFGEPAPMPVCPGSL